MSKFIGNKLLDFGRKIVAVGRNYAAHAKELGNAIPEVRNCIRFIHEGRHWPKRWCLLGLGFETSNK